MAGLDFFFLVGHSYGIMKKNKLFNIRFYALLVLFLAVVLVNCGGEKTEEDYIKESIDAIGEAAEEGSTSGVLNYVSVDYTDYEERTIDDVEKLLESYMERYSKGVAVNVLGLRFGTVGVTEAEIELEVALSSGAAKVFRKAVRYAGQFYRFRVGMVKEGEKWMVKKAAWENISMSELFQESKDKLKELFPNA